MPYNVTVLYQHVTATKAKKFDCLMILEKSQGEGLILLVSIATQPIHVS